MLSYLKMILERPAFRVVAIGFGLALATALLLASGGAVSLISSNQVNSAAGRNQYHVDSSSSLSSPAGGGSSWLTSWSEFPTLGQPGAGLPDNGWTSAWNGTAWTTAISHNISGRAAGNLFVTTDPNTGRYILVGLDLIGGTVSLQLLFQTSTDYTGQFWNPPTLPLAGTSADFPSVAVAPNGLIGIGFNTVNSSGAPNGFATIFSPDGGATWSSTPVFVDGSGTGVNFGRIVAVGNTFYAFLPGTDPNSPISPATLRVYQWSGSSWFLSQNLMTYTAPSTNSPSGTLYCNSYAGSPNNGQCGVIGYGPFIDAAATSAGWAVLCPYSLTGSPTVNNYIFCTQTAGCSTMNYSLDLFMGGITTSSNGDLWISALTYSSNSPPSPRVEQIAAYGTSGFSFVTGVPVGGIDPTTWAFFPSLTLGSNHCQAIGLYNCFSAGDYIHPAMNKFTGASLPFIASPSNVFTELLQNFVQDPEAGLTPVSGLTFRKVPIGSNVAFVGSMSADEVLRHTPRTHAVLWPTK